MFPTPGTPAPELTLPLINGQQWTLDRQEPDFMTMLIFYRGLHCPVCKTYLQKLHALSHDLIQRGVFFIAVSADPKDRAETAGAEWDIAEVPLAYQFDVNEAKNWGLLVSEAITESEPRYFVEPGLFLIKPDNTVFFGAVQSMPFARPHLDDILNAIDFIKEKDYPPRGVCGHLA